MSALAAALKPADRETDDLDLVERVRDGDERAFELLFERYQPRVRDYVRRRVHDHGRAEDITQEVFLSALRQLRLPTDREIQFKPWIYEIAKNKCIDASRRAGRTSEISFDAYDAIGADDHGRLAEPGATPDAAVEGKVAIDNLCGAFGGLSRTHHDILVLREFEGLSYREIGDRLGMSGPAVESTLFRARKRLSEEYEELVSGERCLRVQRIVDAAGGDATGLRDRRRMARHVAHCQPCRRYALRAGIDLGEIRRPAAAAAARIAGLLPLPAFLRRRWSEDAGPLLGNPGSLPVTQWSANVATLVEPGVMTSWAKAIATAATIAVAGIGAGSAFDERATIVHPGVLGGPPALAPSLDILGRAAGSTAAPPPEPGGTRVLDGDGPAAQRGGGATAAGSSGGRGSAAPSEPGGTSQPGRSAARDSNSSSSPASTNGGARAGGRGSATGASADPVKRVVETVGTDRAAPRVDAGQTAGADVPAGVPADVPAAATPSPPDVASTGSDAVNATVETTDGVDPGVTGAGGSVSSPTSDAASTTTPALSGLGG